MAHTHHHPNKLFTSHMSVESSFNQTSAHIVCIPMPTLHPFKSNFLDGWKHLLQVFARPLLQAFHPAASQTYILYKSTFGAKSQPPLTLSRPFRMLAHFIHSLGPITLNFVSSTLTFILAKCQPQAVLHSSNGMPQLALSTQCLVLSDLVLEIAQSRWSCFSVATVVRVTNLIISFLP